MKESSRKKTTNLNRKFLLLEVAAILAFVIFLALIREKPVRADVTLEELTAPMEEILKENTGWEEKGVQELRKYYGISGAEIESFCLYLPASNMDASELLVLVMKEESQGEEIRKEMEERLENQKKVFESYGVDQMKLLNDARVCIRGRYALFVSSESAGELEKQFLAVLEGK